MTLNPFALLGALVDAVLPDPIADFLQEQVDKVNALLQGETARVIGYGAGVVIYLVAKWSGTIPDVPFDQAVVQAVAAIALLAPIVESIRHYVFSPATVAKLAGADQAKKVEVPAEGTTALVVEPKGGKG